MAYAGHCCAFGIYAEEKIAGVGCPGYSCLQRSNGAGAASRAAFRPGVEILYDCQLDGLTGALRALHGQAYKILPRTLDRATRKTLCSGAAPFMGQLLPYPGEGSGQAPGACRVQRRCAGRPPQRAKFPGYSLSMRCTSENFEMCWLVRLAGRNIKGGLRHPPLCSLFQENG